MTTGTISRTRFTCRFLGHCEGTAGYSVRSAADTSVVASDGLEKLEEVFEEKCEGFLKLFLLSGIDISFQNMCKNRREALLNGKPMVTNAGPVLLSIHPVTTARTYGG
jgi:hypothetical protein